MDKKTKARLVEMIKSIDDLKTELATIKDDEESTYEDLSDRAKEGERGETMSEQIELLDSAVSGLDQAIADLESIGG
jgi:hypothetical protein